LWTGFKDKDPTQKLLTKKNIPKKRSSLINFCWKFWIPICTISFAADNFWNIRKLNQMYPEKKLKNYFSIFLPILFHLYFLMSMGTHYFKVWGLAYLIFLIICDPLLLGQHSGKKQMIADGKSVSMIHFKDQGEYTRSLQFSRFVEKFILLGFNRHVLHHLLPTIPGHRLVEINYNDPHTENWYKWLKKSK
jgi:fatty acid desaturase